MSEQDHSNSPADSSPASLSPAEIVAGPGQRYRVTHFLLVLILIAAGGWCSYDGFVKYPRQNEEARKAGQRLPHGEGGYDTWGIPLNRALGLGLPPAAIFLAIWTLYHSRGAYRLSGDTLHIPGHPPIPLDAICRIDKRKWDKKGIAYIEYEVPGTSDARRSFRLDDYLYDRDPADRIFDRIEKHAQAMAE